MNRGAGNRRSALSKDHPFLSCHARNFQKRVAASRIPLEQPANLWRNDWVWFYGSLSAGVNYIPITKRREGRPNSLFSLLFHAFSRFFGEVIDVIFSHQ